MIISRATVSAELGLTLVVPGHGSVPLVASLSYSADDPYAVRMAFHVGTDEPVEWTFARELLATGLTCPAGEGDVRVWPASPGRREVLNIALSSPFGQARFEAPTSATSGFLHLTYGIVAAGREDEFIDVDNELGQLLRRALQPTNARNCSTPRQGCSGSIRSCSPVSLCI
jgi:Streptomyces sporulation and cell division protein, SsgA